MITPPKIYTADCESDPFKMGRVPKPFIWGLYTENEYCCFSTVKEFVEHIKEIDCVIYAHNGGKFDWHFLVDYFPLNEEILLINGRISKMKIGKAELRDSYNLLPVPLSAYDKMEFDYNKLEENVRHKHMAEIKEYLKSDCIYLYELVMRFIDDYGYHITLASACLNFWKTQNDIKPPKSTNEYYHSLSRFYYGGRVECFEFGIINDSFKVVDINSAYPFAMLANHPYGLDAKVSHELPDTEEKIQRAFITLKCASAGAFPIRKEKGGLYFPNDDIVREFNITGWEFLSAMRYNAIKNVDIIAVVTFGEKINFRPYVNHFYAMKSECKTKNDKAGYLLSKLFLNSLYGKFASNPEEYKNHKFVEPSQLRYEENENYHFAGEYNDKILVARELAENEQNFFDVAVAASITGYVRAYMFESLCKCEGLIYCDTDSIAARDTSALVYDSNELGLWDIEAECIRGAVAGKKMYAFETIDKKCKIASKGVRLNKDDIFKVARGETVKYKNIAPTFSVKKSPHFIERNVVMRTEK